MKLGEIEETNKDPLMKVHISWNFQQRKKERRNNLIKLNKIQLWLSKQEKMKNKSIMRRILTNKNKILRKLIKFKNNNRIN